MPRNLRHRNNLVKSAESLPFLRSMNQLMRTARPPFYLNAEKIQDNPRPSSRLGAFQESKQAVTAPDNVFGLHARPRFLTKSVSESAPVRSRKVP
jgi:hypothetical protein